jgi:hypothetical protein
MEPTVNLIACTISGETAISDDQTRGYADSKANAAAGKTRRAIL